MSACSKKHEHMNGNYYKNKNRYLKEFYEVDKLSLKQCKPPIKEVIESFINVVIKSCRIVQTCLDKKILIKGYKIIKIHYVANNKCGKVLSNCFYIPFCEFIPIKCDHNIEVYDVTAGVEFSEINNWTDRRIWVYTLIFICVKVKETEKKCCNYNKPTDYYDCEIISKCHYNNNYNMDFKNDYLNELEQYSDNSHYNYSEMETQREPSDF